MAFSLSPTSLARGSARHPWRVVGIWVVLLVTSFMLIGNFLPDALTTDAKVTNNPDSAVGQKLLEDRLRGPFKANEAVIIKSDVITVDNPEFRHKVEDILGKINALGPEIIASATSFYESGDANLVSADRNATLIPITMAGSIDDANENVAEVVSIVDGADKAEGFQVLVTGYSTIGHDFNTAAEKDLARSEYGPLPLALIILVLVFGAVIAAFVPVFLALFSILIAVALTAVIGQAFQFSFFVTNMIVMMGLAVGIDYSLFILSRYREERQRGLDIQEALGEAGATAGRAVLFSGLTVIIALMGLLIIPHTIFRSLASGAIFVVFGAVLASLTLLPAALSTAAIPFFDIHLGTSGVSSLPQSFHSKQGFDVLEADFGGGAVSPVEVVIDGDANSQQVLSAVERLKGAASQGESLLNGAAYETNEAGDLGLLTFQLAADPSTDAAIDTVKRLRDEYVPAAFASVDAKVYVAGLAAINLDMFELTDRYTPFVFAFVLSLSFVLLMLVFRSIVVPVKAILMNLLSVGAAYGLLVLVFQKGFLIGPLGFQQVQAIEAWLPLFLFAVLFGLSMDYHVFLLSRIRERFDQTGDNTDAVAFGVRSTGRLITGAALIMVAVFGGFAIGDLVMMQQMGFGLGVAVLLDATIIRSILVPSSMKLLGKWNWYLPPVLSWLPRIGIEGEPSNPAPEAAGGGGS